MATEQHDAGERSGGERADRPGHAYLGSDTPAHWQVLGRVQGVGFRWFVRQQARRWGVRGWVRNLPDGSVEIYAAGGPEGIDGLMAAVRRGPPGAEVADIRILPLEGDRELPEPFSILRG